MGECCMLGCHQPAAEERTTTADVDGETFPVTYRLCARCVTASDQAAAEHVARQAGVQ